MPSLGTTGDSTFIPLREGLVTQYLANPPTPTASTTQVAAQQFGPPQQQNGVPQSLPVAQPRGAVNPDAVLTPISADLLAEISVLINQSNKTTLKPGTTIQCIPRSGPNRRTPPTAIGSFPITAESQRFTNTIIIRMQSAAETGQTDNACWAYAAASASDIRSDRYKVYPGYVVNWWGPAVNPFFNNPWNGSTDGGVFIRDTYTNQRLYIHATPLPLWFDP